MNLRDLAYFESLAHYKNYTMVAEQFHVTQPSITYAVKRLEQAVGAQLMMRNQSHQELTLTPAGKVLLQAAQSIRAEWESASKEIVRLQANKIRLGLPPIIGTYFFPRVAKELMQQDVLSLVETEEVGSSQLLRYLRQGKVDLALIGATDSFDLNDLETIELARFPFVILTNANDSRQAISFAELADEPFISLDGQYVHYEAFREFANQVNIQPSVIYQTNNVTTLKNMVREGVGSAFITVLASLEDEPGLHKIFLTDQPQPTFRVYMAYRKQHHLTEEQIKIIKTIQEVFK